MSRLWLTKKKELIETAEMITIEVKKLAIANVNRSPPTSIVIFLYSLSFITFLSVSHVSATYISVPILQIKVMSTPKFMLNIPGVMPIIKQRDENGKEREITLTEYKKSIKYPTHRICDKFICAVCFFCNFS